MSFSEWLRMKFSITLSRLITPVRHLGYLYFGPSLIFSYQMYHFEEEINFFKKLQFYPFALMFRTILSILFRQIAWFYNEKYFFTSKNFVILFPILK